MQNGALLAISPLDGVAFAWTVGWTCFQTGQWEIHVERCMRRLLRPGDTAVDVGANLGYFTAVMAQSVGNGGRVWAFEPVPATCDRLRLSASMNGYQQVTAMPLALGDDEGVAEIAFDPRFAGIASFHDDPDAPQADKRLVPVRRLDDLVAEGSVVPPRLMKIDVEGHELAVIGGARKTIAEARPDIIFEFGESRATAGGWTLRELGETITSCADYRFYEIRDDSLQLIPGLAAYAPEEGRYVVDLLATCEAPPGTDGS
jgi:FkbM family methyltransferase